MKNWTKNQVIEALKDKKIVIYDKDFLVEVDEESLTMCDVNGVLYEEWEYVDFGKFKIYQMIENNQIEPRG